MKRSTFPNLVIAGVLTILLIIITGFFYTARAQSENILTQYTDVTVVELSYSPKKFDKALKQLVNSGIKSRKASRIDINLRAGHFFWTVEPELDREGKVVYQVYYKEEDKPIISGTRIADIRKFILEQSKILANNI